MTIKIKGYNDSCEVVLDSMPENSVDTIITDPPYGLQFMGKKWDYDVPSIELWQKCLKVLKPGGTLLCFAGSRTQHRMAINIEDAGFILKDTIMWFYGSGFPKATDISKQLDKGHKRKIIGINTDSRYKYKHKQNKGKFVNTRDSSLVRVQMGQLTEPFTDEAKIWNGWKSHGLKPAYEPIIVAMKPNEGTYANNALVHGVSGLNIDSARIGLTSPKTKGGCNSSNPYHDGKKESTKEDNTKGRYPANIIFSHHEDCKLIGSKEVKGNGHWTHKREIGGKGIYGGGGYEDIDEGNKLKKETVEKWECHEDCPVKQLDDSTGILKSGATTKGRPTWSSKKQHKGYQREAHKNYIQKEDRNANEGGASRFFYCAKASKAERNLGCEDLVEKKSSKLGDGIKSNVGNKNGKPGKTSSEDRKSTNFHPTVKPIKIMEYLCKLTSTPLGGIVLDPFMGSGTTGIACINTDRDFIGIERDKEYFDIAKARLKYHKNLLKRKETSII